jgi:polyhydroxyalkanoate synthesis regulator phasin
MHLDFGLISFIMIIVLWGAYVVSVSRKERRLEERLEKLEDVRRRNGTAMENLSRLEERVQALESQFAHLR